VFEGVRRGGGWGGEGVEETTNNFSQNEGGSSGRALSSRGADKAGSLRHLYNEEKPGVRSAAVSSVKKGETVQSNGGPERSAIYRAGTDEQGGAIKRRMEKEPQSPHSQFGEEGKGPELTVESKLGMSHSVNWIGVYQASGSGRGVLQYSGLKSTNFRSERRVLELASPTIRLLGFQSAATQKKGSLSNSQQKGREIYIQQRVYGKEGHPVAVGRRPLIVCIFQTAFNLGRGIEHYVEGSQASKTLSFTEKPESRRI